MNQPVKRKKKFSYISSVLSISMVLLLLGLFGFLLIASDHMQTYIKENMVVNVFLKPDITAEEVSAAEAAIRNQAFLKELNYISKEQAATDFSNELGQDFVSFLGYNPLMGSFQVKVNAEYNNATELQGVERYLKAINGVTDVSYHKAAYELAQKNVKSVGWVFVALAGIFALIAIVLIHNTVRLNLYAQRFLIKSMQLVGATGWFITKPFIWQSIKNGIWGWVLALLMLISLNQILPIWIPEWNQFDHSLTLVQLYVALLLIGLTISFSSSFFSTRKYLHTRLEDLY